MEKEIIESAVASLPYSELGAEQTENEIWEETEGSVHYKVTRHKLPVPGDIGLIGLTVSGELEPDRHDVMAPFLEAFGEPIQSEVDQIDGVVIETYAWLEG